MVPLLVIIFTWNPPTSMARILFGCGFVIRFSLSLRSVSIANSTSMLSVALGTKIFNLPSRFGALAHDGSLSRVKTWAAPVCLTSEATDTLIFGTIGNTFGTTCAIPPTSVGKT
jgi:hypothetical protein